MVLVDAHQPTVINLADVLHGYPSMFGLLLLMNTPMALYSSFVRPVLSETTKHSLSLWLIESLAFHFISLPAASSLVSNQRSVVRCRLESLPHYLKSLVSLSCKKTNSVTWPSPNAAPF